MRVTNGHTVFSHAELQQLAKLTSILDALEQAHLPGASTSCSQASPQQPQASEQPQRSGPFARGEPNQPHAPHDLACTQMCTAPLLPSTHRPSASAQPQPEPAAPDGHSHLDVDILLSAWKQSVASSAGHAASRPAPGDQQPSAHPHASASLPHVASSQARHQEPAHPDAAAPIPHLSNTQPALGSTTEPHSTVPIISSEEDPALTQRPFPTRLLTRKGVRCLPAALPEACLSGRLRSVTPARGRGTADAGKPALAASCLVQKQVPSAAAHAKLSPAGSWWDGIEDIFAPCSDLQGRKAQHTRRPLWADTPPSSCAVQMHRRAVTASAAEPPLGKVEAGVADSWLAAWSQFAPPQPEPPPCPAEPSGQAAKEQVSRGVCAWPLILCRLVASPYSTAAKPLLCSCCHEPFSRSVTLALMQSLPASSTVDLQLLGHEPA